MDRGPWQATVHRVAESQTQLKQLSTTYTTLKKICNRPPCQGHSGVHSISRNEGLSAKNKQTNKQKTL